MPINLTVGTDTIPITGLQDLENNAMNLLSLGQEFAGSIASALSTLPTNARSTKVSYSGASPQWKTGTALPLMFSLSGSTSGSISVLLPGDTMFAYTDALPSTAAGAPTTTSSPATIPQVVGSGDAYIALELDFSVNGAASGSYSSGAFGFTANASGGTSVTVAFYKHCSPADSLKDALTGAFQHFVLPLTENTLTRLAAGDYMRVLFNANLQLGLGATAGVDKVFGAGQIAQSLTGNQVKAVTVGASAKLEVQAGAKLAIGYSYAGAFEMVIWKENAPSTLAHFHLFRSKSQTGTFDLNFGVKITTDATASIAVTTTQLINDLVSRMPAELQPALTSLLTAGVGKTPLNSFVTEANNKIKTWLAPLQSGQCTLDWSASTSDQRLLLTNYTIDTSKPYQPAWNAMMSGRFVDAFNMTGCGVTLDAGSGVEAVYKSTCSMTLNLFGKLNAAWTTTDVASSSLVYLGNGIFHLIADVGVEQICNINGVQKRLDAYFAVDLDIPAAGGAAAAPELNIVFQAINDGKYNGFLVKMLGDLLHGDQATTLQAAFTALANQATFTSTVHLIFSQNAYKNLTASALDPHGVATDSGPDQANYLQYAYACDTIYSPQEPTNMQVGGVRIGYNIWGATESASQGASSGTPAPSRTDWSYIPNQQQAIDYLRAHYGPTSAIAPGDIYNVLSSANAFMNLCGDLQKLSTLGAGAPVTLENWNDLVAQLKKLIQQDLSSFLEFLPATTLALAHAVNVAPALAAAPDPTQPAGTALGVTLTY